MRNFTAEETASLAAQKVIFRDLVTIRLTGLPVGYWVTLADYLSFNFDGQPADHKVS